MCDLKGFTLDILYDALGVSKDICITVVTEDVVGVWLAARDLYVDNPIIAGWNNIISEGHGRIFFNEYYKADIKSKGHTSAKPNSALATKIFSKRRPIERPVKASSLEERIMKFVEEQFQKLKLKINEMSARLKCVEVLQDLQRQKEADDELEVEEEEGAFEDETAEEREEEEGEEAYEELREEEENSEESDEEL